SCHLSLSLLFLFKVTARTELYTLSLHDALPISDPRGLMARSVSRRRALSILTRRRSGSTPPVTTCSTSRRSISAPESHCGCARADRKSTRLNSSHVSISYAVFCLKKKKKNIHLR